MPPNVLLYGDYPEHWILTRRDVVELYDLLAIEAEEQDDHPRREKQQRGAEEAAAIAARARADAERAKQAQ